MKDHQTKSGSRSFKNCLTETLTETELGKETWNKETWNKETWSKAGASADKGYTWRSFSKRTCHKGPHEIVAGLGLWLGSKMEGQEALKKGYAKIAVVLDSLPGSIWEDWDGRIIYIPITDYGVLPIDIARKKAWQLVDLLKAGHTMSMFCIGGHGRTGYMAAIVLGMLGIEDPIEYVRKNYCESAVESSKQIEQIAAILNKPELKRHNTSKLYSYSYSSKYDNGYSKKDDAVVVYYEDSESYNKLPVENRCGDCIYFSSKTPAGNHCPYCLACATYTARLKKACELFSLGVGKGGK